MSFSVLSFRGSVAPAVWSAVVLVCFSFFTQLQGADSTVPAGNSTEPAKSGISASGEVPTDSSPSASEGRFHFPDRPETFDSLFNSHVPNQPLPTPAPAYIPSRRTKRLLDDESSWSFVTPEDIVQDYVSKETGQIPEFGPDGRQRSSLSVVERYYDRQMRGRGMTNAAPQNDIFGPNSTLGGQGNELEGNLNQRGANPVTGLRGLSDPGFNPNSVRPDTLSDLLGLRHNPMLPAAIREREAQEKQMEAFKRALNFQQPPVVSGTLNQFTSAPGRDSASGSSLGGDSVAQTRNPFDPTAGTYNSALAVAAPIAPIAPIAPYAPGQSTIMKAPESLSASRLSPPKPDFSIPQRRF